MDVLIVKTTDLATNLLIVSAYFPPSLDLQIFVAEIKKLLRFLEAHENILLLGDFNARCCTWGDDQTSERDKALEELIYESDLKCINNGKATFRRNERVCSRSVLYLSFISQNITANWNVDEFYIGCSRHYPVTIEVVTNNRQFAKFISKRLLNESLQKVVLTPDFDEIEETFKNEISFATNVIKDGSTPKFWWNSQLQVMFKRQIAAIKKSKKYPTFSNLEAASIEINKWKDMAQKAKKDSFQKKMRRSTMPRIPEVLGDSSVV